MELGTTAAAPSRRSTSTTASSTTAAADGLRATAARAAAARHADLLPAGLQFPAVDGGWELGAAPGQLVTLPSGRGARTHLQLTGTDLDTATELCVLISGINDFSNRYTLLARALAAASPMRAVVSYDHYGRGWSDPAPKGAKYDAATHLGQLEELITHLGRRRERLVLVGHSMGGVVATLFAHKWPDAVRKLVLLAPAGVMQSPVPGFAKLQRLAPAVLAAAIRSSAGAGAPPPGDFHGLADGRVAAIAAWDAAWHAAHIQRNGVRPFAAAASRMPLTTLKPTVRALRGRGTFPVLLLRAQHDPMVVLREKDLGVYRDALGTRLAEVEVPSAGHCLHLEQHDFVAGTVAQFAAHRRSDGPFVPPAVGAAAAMYTPPALAAAATYRRGGSARHRHRHQSPPRPTSAAGPSPPPPAVAAGERRLPAPGATLRRGKSARRRNRHPSVIEAGHAAASG